MANYLVSDVLDDAAQWLGDPEQDRFDAAACVPGYRNGWNDMVRLMRKWKLPDVERDLFTVITPFTGLLHPATLAADFATPIEIWERGSPVSVAVTNGTNTSPIVITTATPHGRATNDEIQLTGTDPAVDDYFYITVLSSTTFSLNGSTALGAAFTTGTILYSNEEFVPVNQVMDFAPVSSGNATSTIGAWHWRNRNIYMRPCTASRELQIHFRTSGAPPLTGYLGFDDARDFLSHATAAYVAKANDMPISDSERLIAYGPTGQADGRGGILRDLMMPLLTQKQSVPRRPQPFRPHRADPARATIL